MGVGKCVTKENPKSDLDLDLGFVKSIKTISPELIASQACIVITVFIQLFSRVVVEVGLGCDNF